MLRILRRVFVLFAAAVLAALVAFVGFDVWATRKARADLARLEQKYGFVGGRSIVAPSVAPADNSARLVQAAASVTIKSEDESGINLLPALIARVEQLPDASPVPESSARSWVRTMTRSGSPARP